MRSRISWSCSGQEVADLAADARRATGDQRDLTQVEAVEVLHPTHRRAPGAGGLDDRGGEVQVDLPDVARREQQSRRLSAREGQRLGLLVGVADDLVAPLHPLLRLCGRALLALVPPHAA
jgi:hypothetical protein